MSPLDILTGTPVWVWPLLALILVLGLNAVRDRKSPIWILAVLPLLGILGLRSMLTIHAAALGWLLFAVAYAGGVLIGRALQPRWLFGVADGRVHLKGEALTLTLTLSLFMLNYATGVLRAVAPEVVASPVVQIVFPLIEGAISGLFLGRFLATLAVVRGRLRPQAV